MATEDGFYDGYFIPKGALILLAGVQIIDPLLSQERWYLGIPGQ
jgi:hypothetical protein